MDRKLRRGSHTCVLPREQTVRREGAARKAEIVKGNDFCCFFALFLLSICFLFSPSETPPCRLIVVQLERHTNRSAVARLVVVGLIGADECVTSRARADDECLCVVRWSLSSKVRYLWMDL